MSAPVDINRNFIDRLKLNNYIIVIGIIGKKVIIFQKCLFWMYLIHDLKML